MLFVGYIWAKGGPVKYTNWEIGQPDTYNGLEACVEINPDTGTWSDRDCRETKNFVCMKEKSKEVLRMFCCIILFDNLFY